MVSTNGLCSGLSNCLDDGIVIYERRNSDFPFNLRSSSHGLGAAFYDAVDGSHHFFAAVRIKASQCSMHLHIIRDDIVYCSAVDAADGKDARIYRIVFTGDHGLKLCDHITGDYDRIDAVFRMSAMSALSFDLDIKEIIGRVCRSLF